MTNETNGQAIITVQQLRRKQACQEQVELFQQIWGERVDVEEEEFLKHADKFDWAWAADNLLPGYDNRYHTNQSWYSAWSERASEHARPLYDAWRALRTERREQADAAEGRGKYYEVYDSYAQACDAAETAYRKALPEGNAIWFARLYREACGITTDEWQLKEKASATEGNAKVDGPDLANVTEGASDGDAVPVSATTAAEADPADDNGGTAASGGLDPVELSANEGAVDSGREAV